MSEIHPSAFVDDQVVLGEGVQIGPQCVLTGRIELGDRVRLISSVTMQGPMKVGADTVFYPGSRIGFEPQDYKFGPGSPTAGVEIGSDCLFRESSTVHAASNNETPTKVGDRVFFMVNAHAGHDVTIGNDVILVNNTALGGHSTIEDRVILSANTLLHQFGRVGRQAMTSGSTTLPNDLPPYFMAVDRARVVGLNLIGMRRSGMAREEINAVKRAFNEVFRKNPPQDELYEMLVERAKDSVAVGHIVAFLDKSTRPICQVGGRRVKRAVHEAEA